MPARKRLPHTEAWDAIQQLCLWPEQKAYEILRPVVLFGDPPGERAQETKANERTLRRQADRFEVEGMVSLFRPTKHQETDDHRSLPPPIRQALVDLKAEYPDFSLRELAQISFVRFGRCPSHHTIKQVLADGPQPSITERHYARYADISEPFQRRLAVIKLHTEGWMPTTIAKYLDVHHSTVYEALNRFRDEGFAGLDDKSRANKRAVRKVDIATKQEVRKIQENPEVGAFRIHAKLRMMGIHLSRATVGRIMAENRKLYGLGKTTTREKKEPKEHPFKAKFRHEIWSVDVRYIEEHQIPGIKGPFYVVSILENFSRAILASDIFQRQDLTAYLMVLYSAIQQHGCPRILVSDSGGIFKATQAKRIYEALGIEKKQIEKRQSWQNLIESKSGARLDEPKQNHMLSFASILASYAFTEGFLSEVVFERLEAIASSAGIQQGVACLAESLPSQVASRAAP
jgi:transposase